MKPINCVQIIDIWLEYLISYNWMQKSLLLDGNNYLKSYNFAPTNNYNQIEIITSSNIIVYNLLVLDLST